MGNASSSQQAAQSETPTFFTQEELSKLRSKLKTGCVGKVQPLLQKKVKELDNTELNIAVTGETGTGKSTLINAMRGLCSGDEGAAAVGTTETTMEPTGYPHPYLPNVRYWDLLGTGTPRFPVGSYLREMQFKKYDFFIIVSAARFRENDEKLATEIKRLGKRFYFVRSKIDADLYYMRQQRKEFDEETEMEKIRSDCVSMLEKAGIPNPTVFLISSFMKDMYDFPRLMEALEHKEPCLCPGPSQPQCGGNSEERDTMASSSESVYFSQQEINELQITYEQGGLSKFAAQIVKKLNDIKNAKLNIAVTGNSGAGKSTFINAMRGLRGCDKGAAKIGISQTTMERTSYKHPDFPNVCFWDMPGVGTLDFQIKDYVSKMGFTTYDFFIIISKDRFTENDAKIAKEIQNLGKKFYFVRSQIDNDLNDLEKQGIVFERKEKLDEVKQHISRDLAKVGISKPIIFLISSLSTEEFDFDKLKQTLLDNLNGIRRDVLLMSLPSTTVKIVELKRAQLKERIWMLATVSGAVGALPVPGLSFLIDLRILVTAIIDFRKSLGLDDASLQRLANVAKKPVGFLKAEVTTPLVGEIDNEFVTQMLVRNRFVAVSVAEMALDFIPIIGSIFGAVSSFGMTYTLLTDVLDELVENVQRVVTVAFATDPSHPQ